VSISSGDVGGPSAGLMFALAFYDLMTPGDLSDGRVVAGTGTISADGEVGPIGAIRDKVIGAEDSGASLFLVPAKNWKQLRGVDTGDMKLARVQTFDDALQALQEGDANAVA
jgi:PDZ domain-containing protein